MLTLSSLMLRWRYERRIKKVKKKLTTLILLLVLATTISANAQNITDTGIDEQSLDLAFMWGEMTLEEITDIPNAEEATWLSVSPKGTYLLALLRDESIRFAIWDTVHHTWMYPSQDVVSGSETDYIYYYRGITDSSMTFVWSPDETYFFTHNTYASDHNYDCSQFFLGNTQNNSIIIGNVKDIIDWIDLNSCIYQACFDPNNEKLYLGIRSWEKPPENVTLLAENEFFTVEYDLSTKKSTFLFANKWFNEQGKEMVADIAGLCYLQQNDFVQLAVDQNNHDLYLRRICKDGDNWTETMTYVNNLLREKKYCYVQLRTGSNQRMYIQFLDHYHDKVRKTIPVYLTPDGTITLGVEREAQSLLISPYGEYAIYGSTLKPASLGLWSENKNDGLRIPVYSDLEENDEIQQFDPYTMNHKKDYVTSIPGQWGGNILLLPAVDGLRVCVISEITDPSSITPPKGHYSIPYGITSIPDFGFSDYEGMTHITIPDTVTSIGAYAFADMPELVSITIPDSITYIGHSAFRNCSNLTKITLPSGLKQLDNGVFEYCSKLKEIILPNGLLRIGSNAFDHCTSLTSICLPDSLTVIENGLFANCESLELVQLPSSLQKIEANAFENCVSLSSITIPDSLVEFENGVFSGCTSLEDLVVSEANWAIGQSADIHFLPRPADGIIDTEYLYEIASPIEWARIVIIPDNVTTICDDAFTSCFRLEKVIIPDSVTSIGTRAFSACPKLKEVQIGNSVESIGDSAFAGCVALKGITLPDSLISIGEEAFSNCTNLVNVTFGDRLEKILNYAFFGCSKLAQVTLGSNLKIIGGYAFAECTMLQNIVLPESLIEIEGGAFYRCESLTQLVIPCNVSSYGPRIIAESGITELVFEEGLKKIECGFTDCNSLQRVILPTTLEEITYSGSFSNCPSLDEWVIDAEHAAYEVIDDVLIQRNQHIAIGFAPAHHDGHFAIPEGVKQVGDCSFAGSCFESVYIPATVEMIGYKAFCGCDRLQSVELADGVHTIGRFAFSWCNALISISLPASLTKIGESTFYKSDNVQIYLEKDSYAEQVAEKAGWPYKYIE